jgi:hypothetical protein
MNHYLAIFSQTAVHNSSGKSFGRWWRFSLPRYLDTAVLAVRVLDMIKHIQQESFFTVEEVVDITDPACPKCIYNWR